MSEAEKILVIDDDLNTLKMVEQFLLLKKYDVTTCLTYRDAQRELGKKTFDAAVVDYFMPDTTGLEIMKAMHETEPDLPVIILTASRDVKIAVEAIKEGAFNYLVKPVEPDELYHNLDNALSNLKLKNENRDLKLNLKEKYNFDHIIGDSGKMVDVFDLTVRAAKVRSTTLIVGETGSGKELVAKAIHYNSDRSEGPFIRINCSALAESLLEAELFGIEKNVATGVDARIGKFEAANGGTLFLDEIGDMGVDTQSKMLRAMQEREIERVGSNTPRKVDIRIIAATNKDLARAIDKKEFRQDLFYRLNVLVIPTPPLRERKSDIQKLVDHFIKKFCDENNLQLKKVSAEAFKILLDYHWPGNVRELENCIERSVIMCDGEYVDAEHLPEYLWNSDSRVPANNQIEPGGLEEAVNNFERNMILAALENNGYKQNKAASELGITERSIWYKIKKLGIDTKKSGL